MADQDKAALEARAAAAQAKIDEIAKRREAREEGQALVEAVEAKELQAAADVALEEAKLEHGETRVRRLEVRAANGKLLGHVIVKAAKPVTWNAFENRIADAVGVKKDEIREHLWRPCLVWPEIARVDQMITELPFLRQRLVNAISDLAGVRVEEVSAK
jgi:hypothetical protein